MFVEDALVPKGPEIEFEGLGFDDAFFGYVANANLGEVRLAGSRAQASEFVGLEFDDVVALGIAVGKGFQLTLWGGGPFAELGQVFVFSIFAHEGK